jgi:hypothetical protein
MTAYSTPRRAAVQAGRFVAHVGEMLLAMLGGMMVFGALFGGVLAAAGTDFQEALETAPEVIAIVLMFNMTVPMVLWMRHRGHPAVRVAEMAGAMVLVGVTAIVLLWASVIESTAICGVECALMIPAMVVVMLLHRDEY